MKPLCGTRQHHLQHQLSRYRLLCATWPTCHVAHESSHQLAPKRLSVCQLIICLPRWHATAYSALPVFHIYNTHICHVANSKLIIFLGKIWYGHKKSIAWYVCSCLYILICVDAKVFHTTALSALPLMYLVWPNFCRTLWHILQGLPICSRPITSPIKKF